MTLAPVVSLVVTTRNRTEPLVRLLQSLAAQHFKQFEVIIVDQNIDKRLDALNFKRWPFEVSHIRSPDEVGASAGRNRGLQRAKGEIVVFPDDDCWYPPTFLSHCLHLMKVLGADILAGRACDEVGRSINGRYELKRTPINRANVWTTGIEWVVMFKRDVLADLDGYRHDLGIGAASPWQACEGQDVMLRALERNYKCWFDPTVYGYHAELSIGAGKARSYARGFGYVLRLHNYSIWSVCWWILRPLLGCGWSISRVRFLEFTYYKDVALGRFEGWRGVVKKHNLPRLSTPIPWLLSF